MTGTAILGKFGAVWILGPVAEDDETRLIKAGKKPIVALTTIMRKLIVIANTKMRDAALITTQNL